MVSVSSSLSKDPQKILVVNLGGIGDFLLSTPALGALKSRYPEAKISFLGVPRVSAFARTTDFFVEVFELDIFDAAARHFILAKAEKAFVVASVLRAKKFDLAINMRTITSWPSAWKMHLLFSLIGAGRWAGRDTDKKGYFFHIKVPETLKSDQHEALYDLETVAALGADVSRPSFSLSVDPAAARRVEEDLSREGIRSFDPVIGVHLGGVPSHRWPQANFLRVIKEVRQAHGCRVVVLGGPTDRGIFKTAADPEVLDVVDRVGRYSIEELIALIARCRLLICNDSGPMHIAAILKVPLVAIFGGGYLGRYDPRKVSDRAEVLYQKADCAPCDRFTCRSMRCLKAIAAEDVIAAANRLMQ